MGKLLLFGIVGVLLLSLRFFLFYSSQKQFYDGQYISFTTTIRQEPKIIGNNLLITAKLDGYDRLSLYLPRTFQLQYGDVIAVAGEVKAKKTYFSVYSPTITSVKNKENMLLAPIYVFRQKVISFFKETLPTIPASLLLGIVFGIKQQMPQAFTESLRTTGVLHVIAASGMNVTIIGGFFTAIFSYFFSRKIAILLSIAGILFYAVLAGLEPSIVRASCMGIIVFTAQIMGRQTLAWYGLLLTGYGMLLYDPRLLTDVGFQLSFTATLGLLYIRPLFEVNQRIKILLQKSLIGEELATTIAAQLATLGVILYHFGTYSLWSIVVNGLVLWVVPILMILGGSGAIIAFLFEPLGKFLLYSSLPLLMYFQTVVMFFTKIGGVVEFHEVSWQFVIGYYLLLTAIILILRKKQEKHL